MSYTSLQMADEWNENETVGKSFVRDNLQNVTSGNFSNSENESPLPSKEFSDQTRSTDDVQIRESKFQSGNEQRGSRGRRPTTVTRNNYNDERKKEENYRGKRNDKPNQNRNEDFNNDYKRGNQNYNRYDNRNFNRDDHKNDVQTNYDRGNRGENRNDNRRNDSRNEQFDQRSKNRYDNRGGDNRHQNRNRDGRDDFNDKDIQNNKFGQTSKNRNISGDENNAFNHGSRGRGNSSHTGNGGRATTYNNRQKNSNDNSFEKSGDKEKPYIPPTPTENEDEIFASGISTGINFLKFDEISVNVSGENIPSAIETITESGFGKLLLENIQRSGYTTLTPIQKNAIPIIKNGRDIMACAQTGSGKTAAFLLPIIDALLKNEGILTVGKPHVVIVSPTRELTIQIFNETRKFATSSSLKSCLVYGGTSQGYQIENVKKPCHFLIATPGRLLDFIEKGLISFEDTRFMVLDEADRMLDLGFLPSVERIMQNRTMPSPDKRQTLMFSATFPESIQRLAAKFLNQYLFVAVGIIGGASTDVEQNIINVQKFDKRKKLMEILEEDEPSGVMIFVETKRNADFLASFLSETKISTTSIHGDRYQREREEALSDFKSGRMKLLIATSVAARGLDIKNVTHVINYDLPKSIDEYVHRIGRTGRVGNCGKATSFFDPEEDFPIAMDLKKILQQANQPIPSFLENLNTPTTSDQRGGQSRRSNFGGKDVRKGQNHRNFENRENPEVSVQQIQEANEPEEEW